MSLLEFELVRRFAGYQPLLTGRGIVALYLALASARSIAGPGEAIIPTTVCPSVALAAWYAGLTPRFCDVELDSLCMSPRTLAPCLSAATRAVVLVYQFGKSIDPTPIAELTRERGAILIEDIAQAVGGSYRGMPLGTTGDFTVISFNESKILSGEGGVLLTRDQRLRRELTAMERELRPRAARLDRAELAGSFRNLTHGYFDALRANGMTEAVNCFPAFAEAYRKLFLFRSIEHPPETLALLARQLATIETERERRHERYRAYVSALAPDIRLVTFTKEEMCWRLPVLLPSHQHQLRVLQDVRELGALVSNHYFPAAFLFGDAGQANGREIGLRAINLCVDGKTPVEQIPRVCARVNRICEELERGDGSGC